MVACRRDWRRALDYSAINGDRHTALAGAILQLLRRRKDPMSFKSICHWFSGTPDAFVAEALDRAISGGLIRIARNGLSRRAGYVYEVVR